VAFSARISGLTWESGSSCLTETQYSLSNALEQQHPPLPMLLILCNSCLKIVVSSAVAFSLIARFPVQSPFGLSSWLDAGSEASVSSSDYVGAEKDTLRVDSRPILFKPSWPLPQLVFLHESRCSSFLVCCVKRRPAAAI
jgi:hypothetical protein